MGNRPTYGPGHVALELTSPRRRRRLRLLRRRDLRLRRRQLAWHRLCPLACRGGGLSLLAYNLSPVRGLSLRLHIVRMIVRMRLCLLSVVHVHIDIGARLAEYDRVTKGIRHIL